MTTATRRSPGPQQDGSFYDPYDGLSNAELESEIEALFDRPRTQPSVHTTIRLPADVVAALRRIGAARGMPYQTVARRILADAVQRLGRAAGRRKAGGRK